ncbi:iron ABC transporter permease, partial [bacterium]|nr:iron ABC transporter permease [bacterium]
MKRFIYILCFLILGAFLVYPLFYVVSQSFIVDNKFTIEIIKAAAGNYILRTSLIKSFSLGIIVVFLTSLIGISLAFFFYRYKFRGREILKVAFFLPLIASPFVGAIGVRQILSRFGSLNLILIKLGMLKNPISWIGSGFAGIVLLQSLHLYPIMFLNISAALNNFDIECEEASFNLGATFWQTFRKITFPLLLPGYFAAASIIFIWSITDLGTPLVFDYPNIISVQIFNHIK